MLMALQAHTCAALWVYIYIVVYLHKQIVNRKFTTQVVCTARLSVQSSSTQRETALVTYQHWCQLHSEIPAHLCQRHHRVSESCHKVCKFTTETLFNLDAIHDPTYIVHVHVVSCTCTCTCMLKRTNQVYSRVVLFGQLVKTGYCIVSDLCILLSGIRQKPSSPVPSPEKSSPNKSPPVQAIKGFNPNAPTFVPMALQNQRPANVSLHMHVQLLSLTLSSLKLYFLLLFPSLASNKFDPWSSSYT